MSERLQNADFNQEKGEKEKVYNSVSEYLSAFEQSPEFQEALAEHGRKIKSERPELVLDRGTLIEGLREVPAYRKALADFYWAGNKLPIDLNAYNEETQKAIKDYWDFLKSIPTHVNVIRATAGGKEDEEIKLFRMEKTRDRFHTFAGLALLGKGVTLENGQTIACGETSSEDESALSLENYSVLGRALVSIITEENALDIVDPNREEKKTTATLNFLNGCRYSNGHWVAKGER